MSEPTHADLLERMDRLHNDMEGMRADMADMKKSTDKFDSLHSAGKVVLVVMLGLGSAISFFLLVANQIKSLMQQ